MPISLTNSKDSVANSVSLIGANSIKHIMDIMPSIIGDAPPTLNTLGQLANAINTDPQIYNALVAMLKTKFP